MSERHGPPPGAGARAAALLGALFVAEELHAYFYQAHVLALTHLLTLGWVSMTICGLIRSHRLPVDWTARHAVASVAWRLTTVAGAA